MTTSFLHSAIEETDRHFFYALGRNAMYAACEAFNIKEGDEILTPAYDCDGSLQPFRVRGHVLKFYRINPYTFDIDIDDINKKISLKTKLIHIINYFGFPQPWDEILTLRSKMDIPILEDNAYSLFSSYQGKSLGNFGDISIFSLRKNFPIMNGGLMRVNSLQYLSQVSISQRVIYFKDWSNMFNSIFKNNFDFQSIQGFLKKAYIKSHRSSLEPPPLYSEEDKGYPVWSERDVVAQDFKCHYMRAISPLSYRQFKKWVALTNNIVLKKRSAYEYLVDSLKDISGIQILWPQLPLGVAPFCLSLLISSNRDHLFSILRKKYHVMAWPTLPGAVLNKLSEFNDVNLLGRKILQLNLPSEHVIKPEFSVYLENLMSDIRSLVEVGQ